MEVYINLIINQYKINYKYTVDQEYNPYDNIYYVDVYTKELITDDITLSSILLENHEEFLFNLDRIIVDVYPDYIKRTLKINYFTNKIWISFIPVILDLHIITMNAITSRNEYILKDLIMRMYKLSKNKYNIKHHIFYNNKDQNIKRFNFEGKGYQILWSKMNKNLDLKNAISLMHADPDDVIMMVPYDSKIKMLPIEIYDIYENKIERFDIIKDIIYATKYKNLKQNFI